MSVKITFSQAREPHSKINKLNHTVCPSDQLVPKSYRGLLLPALPRSFPTVHWKDALVALSNKPITHSVKAVRNSRTLCGYSDSTDNSIGTRAFGALTHYESRGLMYFPQCKVDKKCSTSTWFSDFGIVSVAWLLPSLATTQMHTNHVRISV